LLLGEPAVQTNYALDIGEIIDLARKGLIKVKINAKRSNKAGADTFFGRIYIAQASMLMAHLRY
jgi:hypothetical protein